MGKGAFIGIAAGAALATTAAIMNAWSGAVAAHDEPVQLIATQRDKSDIINAQPMTQHNLRVAHEAMRELSKQCPALGRAARRNGSLNIEAVLDPATNPNQYVHDTGWKRYLDVSTYVDGRLVDYAVGGQPRPGIVVIKAARDPDSSASRICGRAIRKHKMWHRPFVTAPEMQVVDELR